MYFCKRKRPLLRGPLGWGRNVYSTTLVKSSAVSVAAMTLARLIFSSRLSADLNALSTSMPRMNEKANSRENICFSLVSAESRAGLVRIGGAFFRLLFVGPDDHRERDGQDSQPGQPLPVSNNAQSFFACLRHLVLL